MSTFSKALVAGAMSLSILSAPALAEMRSITIGTNPSGSTFFLLGGGLAKLFQQELRIRSTAQPQGGSSVYLPMVASGEMTLGISSNIDAGMAYRGDFNYPQPIEELRAIGNIWQLPYAYIVTEASGITTMEELKGRRVMGDMPTNVALTEINKAMLASAGLGTQDVEFTASGGLIDGIEAVVQGRTDAAPVATSMPALTEAHTATPLRIISNGAQATDGFYAGLVPGTRVFVQEPSERSPFVVGETPVLAYDTLIVTSASQSDDDVYNLAKVVHENWERMKEDYPPMRGLTEQDFVIVNTTVPYHPGAIRYFKEVGLWTEAHDANQEQFD